YEETRRRETWLQASSEITTSLLSGAASHDVLSMLASSAKAMTDADDVLVMLPDDAGQNLTIEVAEGRQAEDLRVSSVPVDGSVTGHVFTTGEPLIEISWHLPAESPLSRLGAGPALVVPLGAPQSLRGVIAMVKRPGRLPFARGDLAMMMAFSGQAAIALELAETRRDAERLRLLEDRDRIAKDLHDVVIQRLFATAMTLMGGLRMVERPEAAARVQQAVDDLDETIRQIRSTIFALQVSRGPEAPSLRAQIVEMVEDARGHLGFMPGLRMEGQVDHQIPEQVAEHLLAVLRETLSNVVRHAKATRADVGVIVADDTLTLVVEDNGVGIQEKGRRSGLRNLEERAARCGGVMEVGSPATGGTRIHWSVPL
ncbi:sensor histidine kinase, partial [Nonomuraea sp. NPDC004354]